MEYEAWSGFSNIEAFEPVNPFLTSRKIFSTIFPVLAIIVKCALKHASVTVIATYWTALATIKRDLLSQE